MSAYDRAVKQMQDTGQIRYETMRELLGLPSGWSIIAYRLRCVCAQFTQIWEQVLGDLDRAE